MGILGSANYKRCTAWHNAEPRANQPWPFAPRHHFSVATAARRGLTGAVSHTLPEINVMPRDTFVRVFGSMFEHSPWIAERVAGQRPFINVENLRAAFFSVVQGATQDEQLALIRAHPDLVGQAVLTAESKGEQAAAGLSDLSADEVTLFDRHNREYKMRFGFPFVICARLNKKEAILKAFPRRVQNSPDAERATALEEIENIASLRLSSLVTE